CNFDAAPGQAAWQHLGQESPTVQENLQNTRKAPKPHKAEERLNVTWRLLVDADGALRRGGKPQGARRHLPGVPSADASMIRSPADIGNTGKCGSARSSRCTF